MTMASRNLVLLCVIPWIWLSSAAMKDCNLLDTFRRKENFNKAVYHNLFGTKIVAPNQFNKDADKYEPYKVSGSGEINIYFYPKREVIASYRAIDFRWTSGEVIPSWEFSMSTTKPEIEHSIESRTRHSRETAGILLMDRKVCVGFKLFALDKFLRREQKWQRIASQSEYHNRTGRANVTLPAYYIDQLVPIGCNEPYPERPCPAT